MEEREKPEKDISFVEKESERAKTKKLLKDLNDLSERIQEYSRLHPPLSIPSLFRIRQLLADEPLEMAEALYSDIENMLNMLDAHTQTQPEVFKGKEHARKTSQLVYTLDFSIVAIFALIYPNADLSAYKYWTQSTKDIVNYFVNLRREAPDIHPP